MSSRNKKRPADGDSAAPSPKRPKKEAKGAEAAAAPVAYTPRRNIPGVHHAPTVQEIVSDELTQTSVKYWSPSSGGSVKPFDNKVVEQIYREHIAPSDFTLSRIMLLELSHYLEKFLWPNFDAKKSSHAHLLSILAMVNEKFRENVPAWDCFHETPKEKYAVFWDAVIKVFMDKRKLTIREKTIYVIFLINVFQSVSDELIRPHCLKLVSLPLWKNLSESRLQYELHKAPKWQKHWKSFQKKKVAESESSFLVGLLKDFLATLSTITPDNADAGAIRYCERFVEFVTDLLNQLPTRRFFKVILDDSHLVVRCRFSALHTMPEGKIFRQLLQMLRFYQGFEINDYTGSALTDEEMLREHYEKMKLLQAIAFKHFPELKKIALSSIASIDSRDNLRKHLSVLEDARLREFCEALHLLGPQNSDGKESREFLLEIVIVNFEKRASQIQNLNEKSIYPDEKLLWDENVIPTSSFSGTEALALPKLNLQFLTFHDHLLRNFTLFRLESTYEIRGDVEDIIKRMQPRKTVQHSTSFKGWSRMALALTHFKVKTVGKPKVGETNPSEVLAEVSFVLPRQGQSIRQEWESLRIHDVIFLISVQATIAEGEGPNPEEKEFRKQYGLKYLRGAEIYEMLDEDGTLINENDPTQVRKGSKRTLRVKLDPAQYQKDLVAQQKVGGDEDPYVTFNVVMRRKPKENNFKSVLQTIRDLMNTKFIVPEWLRDVFLGYGNPSASQNIEQMKTVDFVDTFLDVEHIKDCFPNFSLRLENNETQGPYRLTFPSADAKNKVLTVEPYARQVAVGPYPEDKPKANPIRFTSVQVSAIHQAMNKGLTLVVGPPGTGKTDVAVQIVSNWYHNFPDQRTLLVTHSNSALNQIFEKIMHLDIDERHLVRLGHGQKSLETEKDFSRNGRVNYMLELREKMLKQVEQLARVMGHSAEDVAYTAETSEAFYTSYVVAQWEKFESDLTGEKNVAAIAAKFPFTKFFADVAPLFKGASFDQDMDMARGSYRHIQKIFAQLRDCRAFELLKIAKDRGNYLITRQAKIIAMTCTHAALKRAELVSLGFKYDNILMEEAAQILEIETFIPMLLQEQDPEAPARLKRVVLIGDHNQLPPIVKNMAFQKFGHLDQSLFTRFVRLGVPAITLDAQGRARADLASLYTWRYKNLSNLPHVLAQSEFARANPGFVYNFQLINVDDYEGHGELEPNPYFYQNLGEAEYVVFCYMYMRILGYPAHKISIITSYNGQKALIRDIIRQRCEWNPKFGAPAKITTVDKFQGQQNDYILLSLVRTKTVGHIRDVRRLVVAMSRARLGLYVFCRKDLFKDCYELTPTFSKLLSRPDKLTLVPNETFAESTRTVEDKIPEASLFTVEDVIHMAQIVAPSVGVAPPPPAIEQNPEMQVDASADGEEPKKDD